MTGCNQCYNETNSPFFIFFSATGAREAPDEESGVNLLKPFVTPVK
jgi:hypothetical protein